MRSKRNRILTYDRNGKFKSMRWDRRRQHKTLVLHEQQRKHEVKRFHKWATMNRIRVGTHARWRIAMKAMLMERPELTTIFVRR